jgi:acyl-CoA thioester hydrolase
LVCSLKMTMPDNSLPWPDLAGRLVDGGHVLPVRVYYEDTDFSGLVYHAAYLKFMERGRSDFLRLLGVFHARLDALGSADRMVFAVSHMDLNFLKAARIDDVLEVGTVSRSARGARIILGQRVSRSGQDLVRASVTVALIGKDGRPRRIPADMVAKLSPG